MSRKNRPGGPYVAPIKSDGTEPSPAPGTDATVNGRGVYTLEAGTYYYPIGGSDAPILSVQIQWDAAAALTSITVEDTNFEENEASNISAVAGAWIDEDPTTAFVGTVSAGTTVTNGVVAHTAGAAGGAMFHVSGTGARRTRLKVVVGTGGEVRVACWAKD